MGLDMYLYKVHYVGASFTTPDKVSGTLSVDGKLIPVRWDRVSSIRELVISWRKANAIHGWFVDTCQQGEDDCNAHYVDRENLKGLLEMVDKVLADHSLAPGLLPVTEGFFFGSYEYDQDYFDDLEYTKKELEKLLAENDDERNTNYEYQSSW